MFIVEQSLVLPRSADEVFNFLSDPRNDPRWRSDVRSARVLTNGPLRVGTRIETEISFLGRQRPIYEVSALEPPYREELTGCSGPLRSSVITYLIEPLAEHQCRFTLRFAVRPTGLLRLLEPLIRPPFKQQLAQFMTNLPQAIQ